ncbi:sensor histidine kinase [Azospirillum sp. ST 5-10]|uniref:sensor histidine kinase n=1 Tax=unclassified Azospirillum TaxID=2630922 RepID=UPI003F4A7B22
MLAVAAVGIVLSLLAYHTVARYEEREHLSLLGRSADLYAGLLRDQFARREAVTGAVAGMYSASSVVNRGSLRNYADLIASDQSGMVALAWLPRTTPPQAGQVADALRAFDPAIAGILAPGGGRIDTTLFDHDLYPVVAVEPAAAGKALMGLDAASVYGLGAVLRRAAADQRVAASGPLALTAPGAASEVVLVAPVHGDRSALRGYIATVFRLDAVARAAFAPYPTGLFHVHLLDPAAPDAAGPVLTVAASDAEAPEAAVPAGAPRRTVTWGGRPWVLAFTPTAAALPAPMAGEALWALLFGLLLTASAIGYLVLVARATGRLRREVAARGEAEARLRAANERKDLLLKEINHRVKNSLQLVASLFTMQARRIADAEAKDAFTEAVGRIQAVSQVHERLYKTDDVTGIDAASYLRALCGDLTATNPDHVCRIEVPPLRLPTDTAVSLGLIATELVTNAVKHAGAAGAGRIIDVALTTVAPGVLELVVRDYGRGVPDGFDPHRAGGSLGMRVIVTLARQLGGELAVANAAPGARWSVRFPEPGSPLTPAAPPRRAIAGPAPLDAPRRSEVREGMAMTPGMGNPST